MVAMLESKGSPSRGYVPYVKEPDNRNTFKRLLMKVEEGVFQEPRENSGH